MSSNIHTKSRRGAQPGNQNAKGNRGNQRPRPNYGNRGGKGAPKGNQYARSKARTLGHVLFAEYQSIAEARVWLEANSELLHGIAADCGGTSDPVDIAIFCGLTPEDIAEKGMEMAFGLFSFPESEGTATPTEEETTRAA